MPKPSLRFTLISSLLALPGLMGSTAFAGSLHVEESAILSAKPAAVWKIIGDFAGLHGWHPVVAKTEIIKGKDNRKGAVRSIETKDGVKLVEELLAYDGKKATMRYRIIKSPLPVRDYVSTLSVVPAGQGSRVVWQSEFDAVRSETVDDAKAREIVAGIYKAGFDGVKKQLGE